MSQSRPLALLACLLILVAALAAEGETSEPPFYHELDSWNATLRKSLEALEAHGWEPDIAPLESAVLRGGQPARRVAVDVTGARELFLFVTGDPDKVWGVANWADARLVGTDGDVVSLTSPRRFEGLEVLKGRHALDINLHSGLYEPLRIAGREFEHGLHVQADSVVRLRLDGRFVRFEAWVGVDDWAGERGNVRFAVLGARQAARRRLWDRVARDFPRGTQRREMRWEREDRIFHAAWKPGSFVELARRYAAACRRVPPLAIRADRLASAVADENGLARVRKIYLASRRIEEAVRQARQFSFSALRRAITDLVSTHGAAYGEGSRYLERLGSLEAMLPSLLERLEDGELADFHRVEKLSADLESLRREALLANPILDIERLLVIKRKPIGDARRSQWEERGLGEYIGLPRQSSWGNATMKNTLDWANELAVLSPLRPGAGLETLFKPPGRRLVSDVDLDFDGERILFSMPDAEARWQIWEIGVDGKGAPRRLTPGDHPDVHSYDACYLPDGRIAFISTAVLQGVPCNPSVIVGMMYRMNGDGSDIRQVCFEQDHDYYPSVLNDGRVLYLRWDYTDTPHVWNRLLMAMNPDGTGQREYYGSNSYWPNAIFFARAIPDHPTRIVGIVTGHHESRDGELVLFDPAKGRHEASGVVQRIPGHGEKVEPIIDDKPTEHSWPKFLHPWPLSDKYFLVACKPTQDDLWGIYLVDVFDNRVLLREEEGHVLLEPIPLRKRPSPPVLPDRVKPGSDAVVHMMDVYQGPGLRGVPRGTIKKLRVFTYHFGYQTLAGIDHRVGADGPWEIKRILGTVPVEADGSALFRIPARTPISVQPLDADGRAVALMRSWMTAMPGEKLSCVGCHDHQTEAPSNRPTLALSRPPSEITPWYGPSRGFSFRREVQPVLDRYCVECHDGNASDTTSVAPARLPDLRGDRDGYVVFQRGNPDGKFVEGVSREALLKRYGGVFEPAYVELFRYLRTGGLESDLHVLPPGEFHADTQELIQLLEKGHHGVRLDREAWDRLVTWIDLNAPCHGTWREAARIPGDQRERRLALRRLYGGVVEDAEAIPQNAPPAFTAADDARPAVVEQREAPRAVAVHCEDWPFDAQEAARRQAAAGAVMRTIDLGEGVSLELVRIPSGSFVMGDEKGSADEQPPGVVEISKPFWIGKLEVTNEQYRRFDPAHDSRFEHRTSWIFSESYLGWRLDGPKQPVLRVSWERAMAFCRWLSERTGETVTLPTEAQWEYACRAGSSAALSWGGLDGDFSSHANLADATIRRLAVDGWRPRSPDLVVRDDRFDDGALVTTSVGSYRPNAWGLHDMHGNAAEWTRSDWAPYPYRSDGHREPARSESTRKVVRGGSWRDRPARARSAFRLSYPPYRRIFNVGFRIVVLESARRGTRDGRRAD